MLVFIRYEEKPRLISRGFLYVINVFFLLD